jgi:hypothetical protein
VTKIGSMALADLLNPVSLAEAIGQTISIVENPLPGDAGELRTLASAFASAARDAGPIGGDLHTMADQKLPQIWQGDVAVTASQVVNDAGDLVQQLPPAFTYAASAIDCAVGSRFIAVPYCARRLPALPPHALRRSCAPAVWLSLPTH